ncbi:hypothetical protein MM213_02315 [Belliella sp. R4-6]|uniref:Uncharacterized protein n=1 Tax=Belliella alkalica TaxID=1730871 RepID=A0ABS9V7A9_9BACT|nr:hypothetical protein [Belliella alkalica]MCH7412304.1 hypothetical protein [Belliella alkalica]
MITTKLKAIGLCIITMLAVEFSSFAQQISKIAFGSCNKHDLLQPLWEPISSDNPDVFL